MILFLVAPILCILHCDVHVFYPHLEKDGDTTVSRQVQSAFLKYKRRILKIKFTLLGRSVSGEYYL